ncbi:class I SAM-dependent methyltransferase [Kribbella sp. NPDC051770]|uniref:class I SAM-dependent methyltransferase n=1 Tax=Kribbella sp. NPDC051770 TaxID=3155413 RepID=UPI0034351DAB
MVDYDDRLHRVYAAGRAVDQETIDGWMRAYAEIAPPHRPLTVLDLGSGIGRFTPALADTFGGPAYGVEPSARMREQAPEHPNVTYLDGAAEAIPLPDGAVDVALLFLSFHHFRDQQQALHELHRVLKPGGLVLLRSQFADRMPELLWYRYFPSARAVDAAMYRTVEETRRMAVAAQLTPEDELRVIEAERPRSLKTLYERINARALSTFEHLPAAEIEAGFAEFRRDAEADPEQPTPVVGASLMVLRRQG